jgi:hypothetical protein
MRSRYAFSWSSSIGNRKKCQEKDRPKNTNKPGIPIQILIAYLKDWSMTFRKIPKSALRPVYLDALGDRPARPPIVFLASRRESKTKLHCERLKPEKLLSYSKGPHTQNTPAMPWNHKWRLKFEKCENLLDEFYEGRKRREGGNSAKYKLLSSFVFYIILLCFSTNKTSHFIVNCIIDRPYLHNL